MRSAALAVGNFPNLESAIRACQEAKEMPGILWRAMIVLHLYLGIVIGFLMVMWFISGIVMMCVLYSRIRAAEHLHIQPPVSWQSCCNYGSLADDAPALRMRMPGQADFLFDLGSGGRVVVDADTARRVGLQAAKGVIGQPASVVDYQQLPYDQFTLCQAPRGRPFHRLMFEDPDNTAIRGKGGKLSPYRGWLYWHHMTGLVFGVLTLTWVFSVWSR
jgi:hypothetical protein